MTMQFNKKATALVLAGALTITALPLNLNFASEQTRLDYAKSVINQSGMTLLTMPKKNATENDNYLYTAMKNGLFKGVSFDFDGAITEEEKAIMQENLQKVELIIDEGGSTAQGSGGHSGAEIQTQVAETTQKSTVNPNDLNWITEHGTILEPTDYNMNDEIWSDEEFHEILTERQDVLEDVIRIRLRDDHIEDGEPYPYYKWYYDPDMRAFFLKAGQGHEDEKGQYVFNFVNMNEALGGDYMFQTMKAACYHALKNHMKVSMVDHSDKRARLVIQDQDNGSENIKLYLAYENGGRDYFYEDVPEYQDGQTHILQEWSFSRLYEWADLQKLGIDRMSNSNEKHEAMREISYSNSRYTDVLYGICDQVYGEDGLMIYHTIMKEYLEYIDLAVQDDIQTEGSYALEFENYWLMKTDFDNTLPSFGIVAK